MGIQATILVVDDDAAVRDALKRLLEIRDYRVEIAGTGEDALSVLAARPCDLILTDLQMPGMDGLQLLHQIKVSYPNIPVVMITAYAATDVVIQALRGGVSDFLAKPYNVDELVTIVRREIERSQLISSPPASEAAFAEAAPDVLGRQLSPAQLDSIDRVIAELRVETNARCVLVMESTGHVISAKGVIEDINLSALAALVAGDLSAAAGIASLIGENNAFALNYHEGKRYSIYSAHLTPEVFVLIIFGQTVKSGLVLYQTRRVLPELQQIVSNPEGPLPTQVKVQARTDEGEDMASGETFSFDKALASGLLGDDIFSQLDEQFESLWQ